MNTRIMSSSRATTHSLSTLFTLIVVVLNIMMSTSTLGPASPMVQCRANSAAPSRHYPQQLENYLGWIGYGVYFLIVLISCLIFFCIIYHVAFYVWCCRCSCQFLGGSKPRETGYSSNEIQLSICSNAVMFVLFSATIMILILSSVLFTTTLRKVEKETSDVVETFFDRVDNGINSITNTEHIVDNLSDRLDRIIHSFSGINSKIQTIDSSLMGSKQDVLLADSLLSNLQSNFTHLFVLTDRIANESGMAEAPQPNQIPDLSRYRADMQNISSALDKAHSNINIVFNMLNNLVDVQVTGSRKTIESIFSSVMTTVKGPLNQVTEYSSIVRNVMDQGFYYFKVVDNVRISLVMTFLVVVFVVLAIGFVGIWFQWRWSPKITACCSFFLPFLFIVVGFLHIILFIGVVDVCREAEPALSRSQSLIDWIVSKASSNSNARRLSSTFDIDNMLLSSEFDIGTITGNISHVALEVLHCSGNENVLDMIPGLSPNNFLNVTALVDPVRNEITKTLQSFNTSSLTSEASSFLSEYARMRDEMVTVSLQDATQQLWEIQLQLTEIYPQFDNFTRFGYDESIVDLKVDELNLESTKLGGEYWTLDNVTSLDPASSPYNNNQTFFQDQRSLLLDFKSQLDDIINKTNSLKQDALELDRTVDTCLTELSQLESLIVNDQHIKAIQKAIDSVPSTVNDIAQSTMSVANYAIDQVDGLIDNVTQVVHCNYIGNYYKSSKSNVCYLLGPFSGAITLSCWILSIVLLIWFVVLLPTSKRIGFLNPEEGVQEVNHLEMIDIMDPFATLRPV